MENIWGWGCTYIIERPPKKKKPIDILPDFMCFVYKYLLVRHSKDIPSSNSFFFSIHWRILKIFSRSIAAVLTFKLKFPSHNPGIYSSSLEWDDEMIFLFWMAVADTLLSLSLSRLIKNKIKKKKTEQIFFHLISFKEIKFYYYNRVSGSQNIFISFILNVLWYFFFSDSKHKKKKKKR